MQQIASANGETEMGVEGGDRRRGAYMYICLVCLNTPWILFTPRVEYSFFSSPKL